MDWKEQLRQLQPQTEGIPAAVPEEETTSSSAEWKGCLCIRYEKRGGKPSTIVSGFEGGTEQLKALAARLKQHLGIGGSFRDDEILLQGDVRQKAAGELKREGYRVKGDL